MNDLIKAIGFGCVVTLSGALLAASAESTNAPDVKGDFVLVIGGTSHGCQVLTEYGDSRNVCSAVTQRIPLSIITGFTSFQHCTGAGRELQARFNSDGYTLDFSCLATGKKTRP